MSEEAQVQKSKLGGCWLVAIVVFTFLTLGFTVFYITIWRVPDNSQKAHPIIKRAELAYKLSMAIPADENGWTFYEEAAKKLKLQKFGNSNSTFVYGSELQSLVENGIKAKDRPLVAEVEKVNREILQKVDEGFNKKRMVIPYYLYGRTSYSVVPDYSQIEKLGMFLVLMGDYEKSMKNFETSARRYLEAIHLSQGVAWLGGLSYYPLYVEKFSFAHLRRLINSLPDSSPIFKYVLIEMEKKRSGFPNFRDLTELQLYYTIEMLKYMKFQFYSSGGVPSYARLMPIGKIFEREQKIVENQYIEVLKILEEGSDKIVTKLQTIKAPKWSLFGKYLAQTVVNNYILLNTVRVEYDGTMILSALRQYKLDNGQFPDALAHLAPNYLKEIPKDPFADDGAFKYRKEQDGNILFYSIGADGVDDGGIPVQAPAYSQLQTQSGDIVFTEIRKK